MSFFPITLRCGSAFIAHPTKQASSLICHFLELVSYLRVIPEKPSTSSNCHRKNKYQNHLCVVSQNEFFFFCSPPRNEGADQAGILGKFKLLERAIHSAQSQILPISHTLEKGKTGTESSTTDGDPRVSAGPQTCGLT